MTDTPPETAPAESTAGAATPAQGSPAAAPDPKKLEEARKVLTELLGLLELPSRIELKDAADGGIAVALHLEGDVPGISSGKRSNVIDSLQFLANKIVNKPNQEKRWISIGVGAFPEPRQPKGQRQPQQQQQQQQPQQGGALQPQASAPAGAPQPQNGQVRAQPQQGQQQPRAPKPPRGQQQGQPQQQRQAAPDEHSMEPAPDEAFAQAIRELAEKSAKLGRFYAIAPLNMENRARAVKAAQGIDGVKPMLEGEGRGRRVVLVPEKPTAMPKRAVEMPDFDDEEDDEA